MLALFICPVSYSQDLPSLAGLDPETREHVQAYIDEYKAQASELSGTSLGQALGFLGMVFQANELPVAARDYFGQAMTLDAENYIWHYLDGIASYDAGDCETAITRFEKALELFPDYRLALYRQALCHIRLNQTVQADGLLRDLDGTRPGEPAVYAAMAEIAMMQEDYPNAEALLTRALERQPDANRLWRMISISQRAQGNLDAAKESLAKAGDSPPFIDDPVVNQASLLRAGSDHLIAAGLAALKNRRFDQAITLLTQAIERDPQDLVTRNNLARAFELSGDANNALIQLNTVIEANPKYALAWFNRAAIYEQVGRRQKAVDDYQSALAQDDADDAWRYYLANLLMRMERFDDAANHYQTLLKEEASDRNRYLAGVALVKAGQCDQGVALLRARGDDSAEARGLLDLPYVKAVAVCPGLGMTETRSAYQLAKQYYDRSPDLYSAEALAMISKVSGRGRDASDFGTQMVFEAAKIRPDQLSLYSDLNQKINSDQPLSYLLDTEDANVFPGGISGIR